MENNENIFAAWKIIKTCHLEVKGLPRGSQGAPMGLPWGSQGAPWDPQ